MRGKQILRFSLLALLLTFFGQGLASAQAPGPAGTAKRVQLSTADQLQKAESYLTRMESVRQRISLQLSEARQQRDVVKILCLDDKLNQLDVALRSAKDRKRELEAASKEGKQELINHHFTILTVLFQRTEQLDAEAKQCIGKEVGIVGESSSTMEVDPNMPQEDPSDYPTFATIALPPECASCYK